MKKSKELHNARLAKKDEFYTQLADIEKEMCHYTEHFKDKVVFCNCDDPFESNFFKYFAMNFNFLHLKKLICTCYSGSPIEGKELNLFAEEPEPLPTRKPYKLVLTEVKDMNHDGALDIEDIKELIRQDGNILTELKGNGDFRSEECKRLMKVSDIVCTNPPFSLFREYVAQLIDMGKKFIIIGNQNAITYKEIFPLIVENKIWYGASIHSHGRDFQVPDDYPMNAYEYRVDAQGRKFINVSGVRWFTNLDYPQRHEKLILFKHYTPEEYPTYDNSDIINVNKTSDIPCDYEEIMGVPISFFDKYNPEQFEILGIANSARWIGNIPCYTIIKGKKIYNRLLIRRKADLS
nr:adenine-specific methyltransferase EcoRI family protein [uncultured Dialister sp.]